TKHENISPELKEIQELIETKQYITAIENLIKLLQNSLTDNDKDLLAALLEILNSICDKNNETMDLTLIDIKVLLDHPDDWVRLESLLILKKIYPFRREKFENLIEKIVRYSQNLREVSTSKYQQAEDSLLTELGLKDWQPTEESIAVKSFSESFLSSGRLDAEYYQPKYDEIENYFKTFKLIKIRDLINYPVSSGATPKAGGDDYTDEDVGIPFIRAVDLKDGEVDTNNFIFIKRYVHDLTLKKTKVKKNDVLFSIAGTVGRCAIFDHDFEANINQAVSILRFDEAQVKRLYLIVFFNSEIGKMYVSKYARQGLQTNLNLNEVSDLRIPILDYNLQGEISKKVQDSFDIKAKSKQLLEIAKIGVEKAIETDEETATAWINQQLESLGVKLI
ncbi:MAG: hypothetical protein EHM73_07705, partial [Chroococcales cyanobacterium metabat2.561]